MATTFQTELDGTNATALTANSVDGGNSGLDTVTGGWVFDTSVKASGSSSAKLAITAGTGMLTKLHVNSPVNTRYYDWFGRLDSLDLGNIMHGQIKFGATNLAQVVLNASGTVSMKNNTTAVATTGTTLNLNEWYRIMWGVDGITQTLRLWKSATIAGLFGTLTEQITGAYSGTAWDQFKVGCNVTHTLNMWVDKITVDSTQFPNVGTTGNLIPTANAGPDQTKTAGQTVTMAGSGTDTDGTISSYLWAQTAGPAVTMSSLTAQNPTFTAPAVSATTPLIFALKVTDNGGAQSNADSVTITVNPGGGTSSATYSALFNGGTNGAAVGTGAFITAVDTGITYTSDAIGEGALAITGTSTAAVQVITATVTSGGLFFLDFIYKLDTITNGQGPYYIARARAGATVRASIRVNDGSVAGTTLGTLQMRNGTTAGTATTKTVTAGQPFRVQWKLDNTGTTQELKLYTGTNLVGTTPDTGGNITSTYNTGLIDQFGFGFTLAATGKWTLDTLQIDPTAYPSAVTGAPVAHSNLNIMQSDGTYQERSFVIL